MNIEFLQQLDFLLQNVNNESGSKKYSIVFKINNSFYSGNFLYKINKDEIQNPEYKTNGNSNSPQIGTKVVKVVNYNKWSEIRSKFEVKNGSILEEMNNLEIAVHKSKSEDYFDYFIFLDYLLSKYPIEFDKKLPSYIYNLKKLDTNTPIPFLKVDPNTLFDFISIIPEDELEN